MLLIRFIDFTAVQSTTTKWKPVAQPRLLLNEIAMFDMPSTAILDNTFKTMTPFIDTTVNETLR